MVRRNLYMEKLRKLKDLKLIKVITGVRRSGKSTLLSIFQTELQEENSGHFISLNFEDLAFEHLKDYHKLYEYLLSNIQADRMNYIFLDEIQMVEEFQKAVDSLFLLENVDLYLTGSNAYLLSGELSTLLSGRYVEISILPLSFREYYEAKGGEKQLCFQEYYRKGGFPYAIQLEDDEIRREYLLGIYHTVLLKDVVGRNRIQDVQLLESVFKFLFDNIGNIVSAKKIADYLTSDGRRTSNTTISNYIQALKDSFILYEANRYDIKGKQQLKSLEKYYLVDISLRNLLIGEQSRDVGRVLENIVYLELIRRGYKVYIGKLDDLEVDFIAQKGEERQYYQVAAGILDENTYEREFAPLRKIKDHFPKFVLTMDHFPMGENGIVQENIVSFLLS